MHQCQGHPVCAAAKGPPCCLHINPLRPQHTAALLASPSMKVLHCLYPHPTCPGLRPSHLSPTPSCAVLPLCIPSPSTSAAPVPSLPRRRRPPCPPTLAPCCSDSCSAVSSPPN